MRELVVQLSYEYPVMFREHDGEDGRRKVEKVERQASLLSDRVIEFLIKKGFYQLLLTV